MSRKLKFRPVVTRVKLNPEQAVLACNCWDAGLIANALSGKRTVCDGSTSARGQVTDAKTTISSNSVS